MAWTHVPRAFAFLVVGASAAGAQSFRGAATPAQAVQEFMRAVADSNLTRMAQLFGTAKGPAARTHQPPQYEKRIMAIQLYLRGGVQARALGDLPGPKAHTRVVTTQLDHNGCQVTLPITTAKAREGWIVEAFDLNQAAQVNRPCDTSHGNGSG